MKNLNNRFFSKILLFIFLIYGIMYYAVPALPPPDGGAGGTTPERLASPIDDYVFLLIPVAIMLIIYVSKKFKKQLS